MEDTKALGTIIYSGDQTTRHQESAPWLSPFVFHTGLNLFGTERFYKVDEEEVFARLTKDCNKGEDVLKTEIMNGYMLKV